MNANFVLLFVDNPIRSAEFYADLLGQQPLETSPTFAMFALQGGPMLGLWSRHTAEPKPDAPAGASELAFTVEEKAQVDATFMEWGKRGVTIAQKPTDMDFGRTFLALDPDGHRLRVFAPGAA